MLTIRWAVVVLVLALAACGEKSPPPAPPPATAPAVTPTAFAPPADPALAKLYASTCASCHSKPGSGAPQSGNDTEWGPRIDQGWDILMKHVTEGYKGMPPLGSCADCSEAEFKALIGYMAKLP